MAKTTSLVIGLAGVICVLTVGRPAAQKAATLTGIGQGKQLETFVRTPEGDWQTTVKTPDGREEPFVYVPPNKVHPLVRAQASLLNEGPALKVRYRYTVANGPAASQGIAALFFRGVRRSEVKELPAGWSLLTPSNPGNLTFTGPASGKTVRGFPPNSTAEWTLESSALPGVIQIQGMGATSDGLQVTVPQGLTPKQREELDALSRDVMVSTPALGPVIATGLGEPELDFSTLLARALMHYREELQRYRHPIAPDVIRLTSSIGQNATLEDSKVGAALGEVAAAAKREVADDWHQQLSAGLSVCVEALLSGSLPLRGMPEGGK